MYIFGFQDFDLLHFRAHTTGDSQLAVYACTCTSATASLQHAPYDHLLAKSIALMELWLPFPIESAQLFPTSRLFKR